MADDDRGVPWIGFLILANGVAALLVNYFVIGFPTGWDAFERANFYEFCTGYLDESDERCDCILWMFIAAEVKPEDVGKKIEGAWAATPCYMDPYEPL